MLYNNSSHGHTVPLYSTNVIIVNLFFMSLKITDKCKKKHLI